MHNGQLEGFPQLRRKILHRMSDNSFSWIKGSTDSERIIALIIDH